MEHCYPEAEAAAVPLDFNVPSFVATVLEGARPVVVALLREPAARLWISFWFYGQFPAKYRRDERRLRLLLWEPERRVRVVPPRTARGAARCALRRTAPSRRPSTTTATS